MKKQYIKPKTTVMQIHSGTHLLSGSYNFDDEIVINHKTVLDDMESIVGDGDGDDAASRRNYNLWDDFEDDEW